MLARLSKWLVVLTLTLSLSAHWMLLQSVAWVGMIVSYSRDASLTEALSKTFDGAHPCCLCKLVRQGKASEKRQEPIKQEKKADELLPVGRTWSLCRPRFSVTFPPALTSAPSRWETPPKPPPRLA